MTTTTRTQVYAVCDCSGSMAGLPEETMRKLVLDNIAVLSEAERINRGMEYEVTLVPFSGSARKEFPYLASAQGWDRVVQDNVNTGRRGMGGQTALRDAIGLALEAAARDIDTVPALVMVFTDGQENASLVHSAARLRTEIARLERSGNLTITVAGPAGVGAMMEGLGISKENFRLWDGSEKELRRVSVDTQKSLTDYTRSRSTGATRTARFYADASQLTAAGVKAMTKLVVPSDIRVVTRHMSGRAIADYYGRSFQQGKHYYELVKAEYVQDDKDLVVYIKDQNEYRMGSRAVRVLLGLPETGKIRVHPSTNESPYRIFVRTDSVNRKVVEGQTFLTVEG